MPANNGKARRDLRRERAQDRAALHKIAGCNETCKKNRKAVQQKGDLHMSEW